MAKNSEILIGLAEITEYLGVTTNTFKKLVEKGLPATVIDGKWYAHTDNIKEYFKRATLIRSKVIDESAE
jgi:hypothetical protein